MIQKKEKLKQLIQYQIAQYYKEEEHSEIKDEKELKKEETIAISKSNADYNICKVNNISYENQNFIIRNDNSKINNNKNNFLKIE